MESEQHPASFLEVRVHHTHDPVGLTGLCAGYEAGQWRASQLAQHLIRWLPEFALRRSERESIRAHNAVDFLSRAALTVYSSEKYTKRGEVGELLLHVALRQVFNTVPAIAKYFFKDSQNDTVKGFDAVHVIATDETLQLWLGEVKFYTDITRAIHDAMKELAAHTQRRYLRNEFAAIVNKIDDTWPQAERLKKLLDKNTSLDEVFQAVCIPVFLTYESITVCNYRAVTDEFKAAFRAEVEHYHETFCKKGIPQNLTIHLFLFPMESKKNLVEEFNKKLAAWQTLGN